MILVRRETSPEDFHGMVAAKAILTARGGMTRHAAVVARGMGKPCVAGAQAIDVDEERALFARQRADGRARATGSPWTAPPAGSSPARRRWCRPSSTGDFDRLMGWADRLRHLRVRANADTPADAHRARDFGAEGIGLCRTEHMFFEGDAWSPMREMIVAEDTEGRKQALAKLLPMQRGDFEGIFRAMEGFPVTIRLLDPPLHEFLPQGRRGDQGAGDGSWAGASRTCGGSSTSLQEANPMLGPPRLPAGHHLSRDHRDAGPGHLRGRLHGCRPQGAGRCRR